MSVHPTAVIDPEAELGDVVVGPYAVIGGGVRLYDGVRIGPHTVIEGVTHVGAHTEVGAHVCLGGRPGVPSHDRSTNTRLVIGEHNVFRSFSTAYRGSSNGRGETVIGHHSVFQSHSHVGPDSAIGDRVVVGNHAALVGSLEVGNDAVLDALCAVHAGCRVGRLARVGAGAICAQDVPPFSIAQGDRARLNGLNIGGLRRSGLSDSTISALQDAWRILFVGDAPRRMAQSDVGERYREIDEVAELLAFLADSQRGVARAGLAD